MNRALLSLGLITGLAACGDGQPFTFGQTVDPGTDDSGSTNSIDETIARNVDLVGTPSGGSLSVQITGLDGPAIPVSFSRNTALDVPGYEAYSYQDDPLDRFFVAMVETSADGAMLGSAVISGGQFNEYYGGVYYERVQVYTAGSGQVSYAGTYVGLTNINDAGDQLLPVDPGTDPSIVSGQPYIITGDIFLNANFDEATPVINGEIYNRAVLDTDVTAANGNQPTPDGEILDLALTQGVIDADGNFSGAVEMPDRTTVGTYAGQFGGTGGSSVAGGLFLDGDWWDAVENENEIGLFVLTQCGEPGDDPICDQVN